MMPAPPHQDANAIRGFVAFSQLAGVLMIGTALIVLISWWWDLPLLDMLSPWQHGMKANVAIAFGLSGVALLLSRQRGDGPRRTGMWLSLVVLGIGAATFSQHVWSIDLGIDHLFADFRASQLGLPPGRMPALVAVALVLVGGQGLLVSTGRWVLLREGLAIGLLAIAVMGLSSYGLALADQRNSQFERVPMHTIVLLLVATLGWMSSAPTTGLTRVATADTFGGTFARYLLLPALLLPVFFSFAFEALQSWFGASRAFAFALSALLTGGTVACLVWWVATLLDQVERQRRESTVLRDEASTDVLTGLSNRRGFDNALVELLDRHREHAVVFSLLMIDLDRFKAYNDDFGHQEGDEALRIAGRILRTVLRHADLAARYGGEEFALLLLGADAARANMTAQRILEEFRAYRWPLRSVTASIGIVQARTNECAQEIVRRADNALYNAKYGGRDRAAAYSDGQGAPAAGDIGAFMKKGSGSIFG